MLLHKKITILVVDDELSIRESLRGWLKQDGYQVETAAAKVLGINRTTLYNKIKKYGLLS